MEKLTLFNGVLRGQRIRFLLAMASVAIVSLVTLFPQQILRYTLDTVIAGKPSELPGWGNAIATALGGPGYLRSNLWICALAMISVALLNGLFTFLRTRLFVQSSEKSIQNLRDRLYDHIQRLPYDSLMKRDTGDLLQRCSSDMNTIRRFLSAEVSEISRAIWLLVFALVVMLPMSRTMTLVSLGCTPLLVIMSYLYFKRVRLMFRDVDEREAAMSTVLQENLTGMRVVRAFGQQKRESDKFNARSTAYRDEALRLHKLISLYWAVSDFIVYMQIAICSVFQVQAGLLTVGTLITFISYTSTLLWPIRQMGRILANLGRTHVAVSRIDEVLHLPLEEDAPNAETSPIKGDVVFENVHFSYDQEAEVLRGVSFHASPGQTVAVLGATGSGKSTMMLLLQRLYDATQGRILIDGVDVTAYERAHLRRHVGLVLQEPFLYSRTISENIAITLPSVDHERVQKAAQIAALSEMEAEFLQGFDTMVGERGVTLSGGQRQRIAIARMLIAETPIMVFDDSLSALDNQTDAAIRAALRARRAKATTFIISHRINTLREADLILVLEDGQIVQQGSHEELIACDGLYRRVYLMQGGEEEAQ